MSPLYPGRPDPCAARRNKTVGRGADGATGRSGLDCSAIGETAQKWQKKIKHNINLARKSTTHEQQI
eukprot:6515075-Pyramimonas_sp.AAC.1